MRTTVIVLSLIALTGLFVGISSVYSHKSLREEGIPAEKRVATLGEWQKCRNKSNYGICDYIIANATALEQCYDAAVDFASICYPNHAKTTPECAEFWNFYATAEAQDALPTEYFTCVE